MSLVGFKAKNHRQQIAKHGADDGTDDRRTPPEIFQPLDDEHGFTLDVAASRENTKVPQAYFTKAMNGLAQSWADEVVWCNPPYSNLKDWVAKAFLETGKDCKRVVMLLPANRCEQAWWQDFIEPRRDRGMGVATKFLRGRPRFGGPPGRVIPKKGDRPPFGLVIVTIEG